MALRTTSPFLHRFKGHRPCPGTNYLILNSRPQGLCPFQNASSIVSFAMNMTGGQSDGSRRLNLDHAMGELQKVWEGFPQPVKTFPWVEAAENFVQLIVDLVCAVIKYLSVPLLVVSSLSEMSYCAHERKMVLIPFPLLAGIAIAGVLRDTALELSPRLKDAECPWHLIAIAIFFTLLKLPGPYYPYWGRIIIPHFANGGLLGILLFAFLWYRRPQEATKTTLQSISIDDSQSEQKQP